MTVVELSIVAVVLGFFGVFLCIVFLFALVRGVRWRRQIDETATRFPQIREALVDYASGTEDLSNLQALVKTSRNDFADAIVSFQGTLGGSALDRLCNLAQRLGLVSDWIDDAHGGDPIRKRTAFKRLVFVSTNEPCRRLMGDVLVQALHYPDPEVWLSACQAVIQTGTREQVEAVFELAVSHSLLIRVLLIEGMRRHAAMLCQRAVPDALRSPDPNRVLAALDILVAWERAVAIGNLRDLLRHPAREVRLRALKLAPLVPLTPDNRTAIVNALGDADAEIAIEAAVCASRLQIDEALATLARILRTGPAGMARTAADALAGMPPKGWEALEELSNSSNAVTSAAAADALDRVRGKAAR